MKSRQFIWLLLFSTALNLNAFALSNSSIEPTTSKKVFILIRSEQNQQQLAKFKQQINSYLILQNVVAEIETYKRSEPLPQAKIFKTAYSGNYDVLLLIEQIAKYTIDNRVTNSIMKMGGKYKIQSYNLKETPYTWVDHGDSNCNLSVDLSLQAFTKKILATIDIEPSKASHNALKEVVTTNNNASNQDLRLYYKLLDDIKSQRKKTKLLLLRIQELKYKLQNSAILPQKFAELKTH